MAILEWDKSGEHFYETGVDKCVLFVYNSATPGYDNGVAWNGLTNVSEKPTGAETTSIYANNSKYINLVSTEEFEASLEAYTFPDAFAECDGSANLKGTGGTAIEGAAIGQQPRKTFGLCYRTRLGNDQAGDEFGYKLHFIYGATASPSEKSYATVNDSPEAITFSWEMKTTPVNVTGFKPTASVVVDSSKFTTTTQAAALKSLEDKIYGTTSTESTLPMPDEIATILGGVPAVAAQNQNQNHAKQANK